MGKTRPKELSAGLADPILSQVELKNWILKYRNWLRESADDGSIWTLDDDSKDRIARFFPLTSGDKQLLANTGWTNWLLLGGRGSGKTRAGAEWIRAAATGNRLLFSKPVGRIALVGETYGDVREVMIEGPSGLLAVHPRADRPKWTPSRRRLEWPNGAVAQTFSSEDPDALRGPQFAACWADELAKWKNPRETWDMLQFGLRLGDNPRQVITTTPRPVELLKELLADERTHVTRLTTDDNRKHLAKAFFDKIVAVYRGTRLGRQELDGELIDDRPGTLWSRDMVELHRVSATPELTRIVIAVDPPVTGKASSDQCGIIAAGKGADGRAYILRDCTMASVSPSAWSAMVAQLYRALDADLVVIETNQGGDMAESVLRAADPTLPIRQVKASRGKYLRAEPVAHLYERGLVSHLAGLSDLEDEMCDFGLDGLSSGRSPDRLDALVWALNELMLQSDAVPRARAL